MVEANKTSLLNTSFQSRLALSASTLSKRSGRPKVGPAMLDYWNQKGLGTRVLLIPIYGEAQPKEGLDPELVVVLPHNPQKIS